MAHRQGLNNASANIHRGAVRLGRVLYGALVHAAVRKGEVVDLRADDGATCSFNQWPSQLSALRIAKQNGVTARCRGADRLGSLIRNYTQRTVKRGLGGLQAQARDGQGTPPRQRGRRRRS